MTSAAIYARVSSARQKKDETIGSQTAALREHAAQARLDVPQEWVFEDEGHSGATLVRPALEALRDLAAQGCVDVVLVYSPDRLARKFAYQALLLEEFARAGVRVEFVKGPRGDSPRRSGWTYPAAMCWRQPVSRYRQGGSGQEGAGHGRCGPGGCGRKGSGPSPAASAPLGRCKGQRGIDLGHGSPDGRRGLAVWLTEQLGCICGGFLGLAEVLFFVHWPSSCLVACFWSDTAHRRSANWSRARNAEADSRTETIPAAREAWLDSAISGVLDPDEQRTLLKAAAIMNRLADSNPRQSAADRIPSPR